MEIYPKCPIIKEQCGRREPHVEALTCDETVKIVELGACLQRHVYEDIIAGFLHFDKFVFVLTSPGSWIGELLKNSLVSFSYLKSLFLKLKVKVKARGE